MQCADGTYSLSLGLRDAQQCLLCPSGAYCSRTTLTPGQPPPKCAAGFFCRQGASVRTPLDGSADYGRCTPGHFCPEGSGAPVACPAGTFRRADGATDVIDCAPCPAGSYCFSGTVDPSRFKCWAGFACVRGAKGQYNRPVRCFSRAPGSFSFFDSASRFRCGEDYLCSLLQSWSFLHGRRRDGV